MDVHMPVMDGLTATREIRALGAALPQPRIVALTASVTTEDRRACLQSGMDGYLSKPIRADELSATLAEIAAERTPPPVAPGPPPATRATAEILDEERFGELDDLPDEIRRPMVASWLTEVVGAEAALRADLAAGDTAAIGFRCHRLKGSSGTLGAVRLAAGCAAVEDAVRDGSRVTTGQLDDLADRLREVAELMAARGHHPVPPAGAPG